MSVYGLICCTCSLFLSSQIEGQATTTPTNSKMITDCVPIPSLTRHFKEITDGTSPRLLDYIKVTASLSLLNDIIAAILDHPYPEEVRMGSAWVLGPFRERVSCFMPHFDFNPLVQAVLEQRHVFTQDVHTFDTYPTGQSRPIGEMWLIACAIHSAADIDNTLDPVLGPFLGPTPFAIGVEHQAAYFEYLGVSSCSTVDSCHPIPELGIALQQVLFLHKTQPLMNLDITDAIYHTIRAFVHIGLNVVDAWQQVRDERQPDALLNDMQEFQIKSGVMKALSFTTDNPHADIPFRIRTLLNCMDIESLIDRVLNSRIQKLVNQGKPTEFVSWFVYQWILEAAVHPSVAEHGVIRDVVGFYFDDDWTSHAPAKPWLANFRPFNLPAEVHYVLPTYHNNNEFRQWVDDHNQAAAAQPVKFKFAGPPIDAREVATVVPVEPGSESCSVCLDDFDGELQCLKLKVCKHAFCEECLKSLVNGMYPHKQCVPCPCCRADVCPRRAIEPVE